MPASTDLSTLDFELIKDNLKNYLKSQSLFKDYDFESSNINVLLDVLAYNSYLNGFYLNMIGNEMFLDTALLKDSVVSHAKELNYLPRSFRSAVANVNLTISAPGESSVLIPRGTSFTGTEGNRDFTFVTAENIAVQSSGESGVFFANNVLLYEGDYVSDSFVTEPDSIKRYRLSNKTVDTTSILVTVIEDNGSSIISYEKSDSLFGLAADTRVFFIQPAEGDTYEIVFGDGVIGRTPKDRSVILVQYRACNGELPNGIRRFSADGAINGALITNVTVNEPARGGAIPESVSSIRFNAPRAFTTQERVVTARDYQTLLINQFPEINDVSAYGGEEEVPPRFGKVIVAVDLKTTDQLPPSRRTEYAAYIKERSPLAIDPVFVTPDYTYIKVDTLVRYNINATRVGSNDVRSLVEGQILSFNQVNLNGFNKTLRYSNLVAAIDASQNAIVSNDTEVLATKTFIPVPRVQSNHILNFGVQLRNDFGSLGNSHSKDQIAVIESSPFLYKGAECFLEDDGKGNLRIMQDDGVNHAFVQNIGTVNYEKGYVQIQNLIVDSLINNAIDVYARPLDLDIRSERNTILSIRPKDITIQIEQVRV